MFSLLKFNGEKYCVIVNLCFVSEYLQTFIVYNDWNYEIQMYFVIMYFSCMYKYMSLAVHSIIYFGSVPIDATIS